ncbi:astrotactin-2-like [Scleropages formosus]|uniref:Astrotactin-2-like n=1 Tax=Scleropages formosus TaxID=113540 RepID=A0A0P7UR36_SCLFO|nr:astrotactin-2-like [Scleropages formosus]
MTAVGGDTFQPYGEEGAGQQSGDNNFIKDFPQLADGLMVIPLPVEEQCRGVLSEPMPNLQLLTGEPKGFSKVLKMLSADTTRDEMLSFIQQYGSHYVSEALYGSELSCTVYFPSRKAQQQLWLQYQKGEQWVAVAWVRFGPEGHLTFGMELSE